MKRMMSLDEFKEFCGDVEKAIFSTEWDRSNITNSNINLYTVFDEIYVTPNNKSIILKSVTGDIAIHSVHSISLTPMPFKDVRVDIFTNSKNRHISVILVFK